MTYHLYYEIENQRNGFKKLINCELFYISDLVKILAFYESIGFKMKVLNFKQRKDLNEKERTLL